MSDFTPGPWKAETEYECAVYAHNNQMKIADIRGYGYLTGKGLGGIGLPDEEAKKIQDANARLIAAAPEMRYLLAIAATSIKELSQNLAVRHKNAAIKAAIETMDEIEVLLERIRERRKQNELHAGTVGN